MNERTEARSGNGFLGGLAASEVLDLTHDTIFLWKVDGAIGYWNRGAEVTYGWSRDEAQGRDPHDLLKTQFPQPFRAIKDAVLRTGRWEGELVHTGRDGTSVAVESRWSLWRDDEGNPSAILEIDIDVTARRWVELERARALQSLRKAYERERRIAKAMQQMLRFEIAEHTFPGLSLAALSEAVLPEAEVGGDFCDAFPLEGGRVALVAADVVGKGLSAAVRSVQVKEVLRAFCWESPGSPAQVLTRLNRFLYESRRREENEDVWFVCVALVVLDPRTGEGSLTSAGGIPVLRLRADGTVETTGASMMPIGLVAQEQLTSVPIRVEPRDTLILATDGIFEARLGDRFLDYEGLAALATGAGAVSLRSLGETILEGARAFSGGALSDDACLLLARRTA
jgi:PAS domain S-box-containing protein